MPAREIAATEWHDHRVDVGQALGHLEANGAGALHHREIVTVVDESAAMLATKRAGRILGSIDVPVAHLHLTTEQFDLGGLDGVDRPGEKDARAHVEQAAAVGHPLAMVAGRRSGHCLYARLLGEQHRIEGAAKLERGDRGDRLVLEPDLRPHPFGQHLRAHQWGLRDVRSDALSRRANPRKGGFLHSLTLQLVSMTSPDIA